VSRDYRRVEAYEWEAPRLGRRIPQGVPSPLRVRPGLRGASRPGSAVGLAWPGR